MNRKINKRHKKPGVKRTIIKPPQTEAEIKEDIMMLAAAQWPEDDIAAVFEISHKELKAKYQEQLTLGPLREKALLIKALKRKARTGDVSAIRLLISLGDESSFLRKSRAASRPMLPAIPDKEKLVKKKVKLEPKLGKKQEELIAARKSHKGTTWEDHLTKQ